MNPELRARVLSAARAEPSPPIGASRVTAVIGFLVAFTPIALFDLRSVALHGRPLGFVVLNVVGWALLAAAATWGAVGRGRSMLGRPQSWLLVVATLTPLALLAVGCARGTPPGPRRPRSKGRRSATSSASTPSSCSLSVRSWRSP